MVSVSEYLSVDRDSFSLVTGSFLPREVIVPLEADDTEKFDILVREGNSVDEGEIIARSKNICVHSSIPGVVREIANHQYANGRQGKAARIELKGSFSFTGKRAERKAWEEYDALTLRHLLKDNGIVNTFASATPLISEVRKFNSAARVLSVRLFDDDPSREVEHFLSKAFLPEVIEGAAILAKAVKAQTIVFSLSKRDKEISEFDFEETVRRIGHDVSIFTVPIDIRKYPCGTKHSIVSAAKKRFDDAALSKFGKNDLFIDSKTALKIHDAVVLGIPSIFEYVHVTGESLNSAAIMKVRIGTPLRFLVEQCGEFKRNAGEIVVNGMISGHSLPSFDIPVSRDIKSVELVPVGKVSRPHTEVCIRCGNCRKTCPAQLWPGNLHRMYRAGAFFADSAKTSLLCSECGLCNAVCPSRLPLCQSVASLKKVLEEVKHEIAR